MVNQPEFDVFLAHNSQDKPQVKAIASELKRRGLKVWIDEEQILPGRPFQDVIQQAISNVKSAAIFIGSQGLGKWQVMELRILISQCVDADIPVIPVLLPGVEGIPGDLLFLQQFNCLSFASGIDDVGVLDKLVSGITQEQPKSSPKTAGNFDVLLCYDDEDRSEVQQIAEQLRQRQIRPWLNLWEVPPGRSWQELLAAQIAQIHSVAIFIGSKSSPWQKEEIESFIWEFIELKRPVIPVILPNVLQEPQLPIYLRSRTRVDFHQDKAEAFYNLEWGITQRKPGNSPKILEENNFSVQETNCYVRLEELLVQHGVNKPSIRQLTLYPYMSTEKV
ncbi:toll/interleukin-1 receptor domain-containing protein [Brasilonema sennae]|nr:toll/interleukin-1 receptor domain-containing protein [Brasilonema sennae]